MTEQDANNVLTANMRRTHNAMLKSGGPDTSMIGKAKAALKRTRFWEDEP